MADRLTRSKSDNSDSCTDSHRVTNIQAGELSFTQIIGHNTSNYFQNRVDGEAIVHLGSVSQVGRFTTALTTTSEPTTWSSSTQICPTGQLLHSSYSIDSVAAGNQTCGVRGTLSESCDSQTERLRLEVREVEETEESREKEEDEEIRGKEEENNEDENSEMSANKGKPIIFIEGRQPDSSAYDIEYIRAGEFILITEDESHGQVSRQLLIVPVAVLPSNLVTQGA